MNDKISAKHLERAAYVYIRQSILQRVRQNFNRASFLPSSSRLGRSSLLASLPLAIMCALAASTLSAVTLLLTACSRLYAAVLVRDRSAA
jgi:hypothetical protein